MLRLEENMTKWNLNFRVSKMNFFFCALLFEKMVDNDDSFQHTEHWKQKYVTLTCNFFHHI